MMPELATLDYDYANLLNRQHVLAGPSLRAAWVALPGRAGGVNWYDLVAGKVGALTNVASPGTRTSGWNVGIAGGLFTPPAAVSLAGTNQFADAGQVEGVTDGVAQFSVIMTMRATASGNLCGGGKGSSNSLRWELVKYSDGNVYYLICNGGVTYGSVAFTDALWHTYAMVYNGAGSGNAGRLQGYVDGRPRTLSFSGTIPATTASVANTFGIGRIPGDVLYYATGHIAATWIYSRALSAVEAAWHAQETMSHYPTLLTRLPLFPALAFPSSARRITPMSARVRSASLKSPYNRGWPWRTPVGNT